MSDKKKLLVVIDPGHTDNTYNAGAVKGYYESKAVYDLSLYVFFVKHFSLKKASEFPVFNEGFSLL